MTDPAHGWTRSGLAVHARTIDHHPDASAYQRTNKAVALWVTGHVFSMTAFWVFCLLALCSLPAILHGFAAFSGVFPRWMVTASLIALIAWLSSNFLQLVLLPSIGVGQNLQSAAADARAAKTFEDVAAILDRLDVSTAGGITVVVDDLAALRAEVAALRGS